MTWPAGWTVNSANSVRFLYRRPVASSGSHGLRFIVNKGIEYGPALAGPFISTAYPWEWRLRVEPNGSFILRGLKVDAPKFTVKPRCGRVL